MEGENKNNNNSNNILDEENKDINFILKESHDEENSTREYPLKDEEINDDYFEETYKKANSYYNNNERTTVKRTKKRRKILPYFIVALISSLIGGFIVAYIAPLYLYGKIIPMPNIYYGQPYMGQEITISPEEKIGAVEAVSKKAMKSVVGITTVQAGVDFFFRPIKTQGVGSGVIVSSDGYIITNSHVVGNGQNAEINVLFENGTKLPGDVLWYDIALDLAVVKVESTGLPAADLGDSDILEVGELAVAIGNPLGLEFERTVTSGVISGLNRSIEVDGNKIEDLIQTDASINPGNSGGPLLNGKGEVIGINTAKISTGEGLGLAIPINIIKPIVNEVVETGKFNPVLLGIQGIAVEKYEQALGIELKAEKGVYVAEVITNTPAYRSGLRSGDVITKIGQKEVKTMNELKKELYKYKTGDKAKLDIIRNGEALELEVIFEEKLEG